MGKPKSLKDKLFGAAVLKMSFVLRDAVDSPAFKGVYPGVLRDLGLEDAQVEEYIAINRDGSIAGRPGLVGQTGVTGANAAYARAFAEAAARAVLRCAPLKLPADQYDQWKAVEINFDPSEL